jgi:two-component system, LytTR family, response regulator
MVSMEPTAPAVRPIRTAIVDDEPLARERLRQLLSAESDLQIVGEYRTGSAFLAGLTTARPDLVFIDIEMPALSGFDVVESMRSTTARCPVFVFVTAFDSYAVRAFDIEAADYVLKPFNRVRFTRTLNRIRRQFAAAPAPEPQTPPRNKELTRVAIKNGGRIQFVRLDQVDWIEAAANYVRLHVGRGSHLYRGSMQALEQRLDGSRFVRIHRSTIVNVERIAELHPTFDREQIVLLQDGTRLRMSPGYRDRLQALVDGL